MRKWITLLKSIIFSFLIYVWFLGSSLLIDIDSDLQFQEVVFRKLDKKMAELSVNIKLYCERNASNKHETHKRGHTNTTNLPPEVEELRQARQEKSVRDNLIYIPELKQMWCLVPKAASTSWSHKIVESLSKQSKKFREDLHNLSIPIQVTLRKHYGNIGTKKYREILTSTSVRKVLIVRHPFARLVSAFENKLKDRKAQTDSMYFYGHYGVKINRSFRKNRRRNKRKEPTFEEFIEYLINTDPINYDEHWKPISLLCGLCQVHYDQIIKQEELTGTTLSYHLTKLGFDSPTKGFFRKNAKYAANSTYNAYVKNIPLEMLQKLLVKYEDDFRLFDYDYTTTFQEKNQDG